MNNMSLYDLPSELLIDEIFRYLPSNDIKNTLLCNYHLNSYNTLNTWTYMLKREKKYLNQTKQKIINELIEYIDNNKLLYFHLYDSLITNNPDDQFHIDQIFIKKYAKNRQKYSFTTDYFYIDRPKNIKRTLYYYYNFIKELIINGKMNTVIMELLNNYYNRNHNIPNNSYYKYNYKTLTSFRKRRIKDHCLSFLSLSIKHHNYQIIDFLLDRIRILETRSYLMACTYNNRYYIDKTINIIKLFPFSDYTTMINMLYHCLFNDNYGLALHIINQTKFDFTMYNYHSFIKLPRYRYYKYLIKFIQDIDNFLYVNLYFYIDITVMAKFDMTNEIVYLIENKKIKPDPLDYNKMLYISAKRNNIKLTKYILKNHIIVNKVIELHQSNISYKISKPYLQAARLHRYKIIELYFKYMTDFFDETIISKIIHYFDRKKI